MPRNPQDMTVNKSETHKGSKIVTESRKTIEKRKN
jgi:hypothetical protein